MIFAPARTVFVLHNPKHVPGAGSCIFLHAGHDNGSPTVGCTAMPIERLEDLMTWRVATDEPLLIQLPAAAWKSLAPGWGMGTVFNY